MKQVLAILGLLVVLSSCGGGGSTVKQTPVSPTPPTSPSPGTPPNLDGNWEIKFPSPTSTTGTSYIGATTAGIALEESTPCEQFGLAASTACYQPTPDSYPIEWVGGFCNGGGGLNPYVSQFVMGQSLNQVQFQINASFDVYHGSVPPSFTVTGSGTITQSGSQFQMSGTFAVSNPTSDCAIVAGVWSATQAQP
ncbi:MAG: hypothetical protein ABSH52_09165 [Terriglobia bacterium]|jgi:hypothetical protein